MAVLDTSEALPAPALWRHLPLALVLLVDICSSQLRQRWLKA